MIQWTQYREYIIFDIYEDMNINLKGVSTMDVIL